MITWKTFNKNNFLQISSAYILTRKNYICIKIQIAEKSSMMILNIMEKILLIFKLKTII